MKTKTEDNKVLTTEQFILRVESYFSLSRFFICNDYCPTKNNCIEEGRITPCFADYNLFISNKQREECEEMEEIRRMRLGYEKEQN